MDSASGFGTSDSCKEPVAKLARVVRRYLSESQPASRLSHHLVQAKKSIDPDRLLSDYGLKGLALGVPVKLYHGTSASFSEFNLTKNRDELVNKFYGRGIFLTPSRKVAWEYAHANRNKGLPKDVIDDLLRVNRKAGTLLLAFYTKGASAWDGYSLDADLGGVDPNDLMDVSKHILGTAYRDQQAPDGREEILNVLRGGGTGSPSWIYDKLDSIGLDSIKYRPKVLTVVVTVSNPLVTKSKAEARRAPSKGYDSVVYYGSDLVGNVPEVAIYDPSRARITDVEV